MRPETLSGEYTSGEFHTRPLPVAASASAIPVQSSAGASTGIEGTGASASSSKAADKKTANAEYQDGVVCPVTPALATCRGRGPSTANRTSRRTAAGSAARASAPS